MSLLEKIEIEKQTIEYFGGQVDENAAIIILCIKTFPLHVSSLYYLIFRNRTNLQPFVNWSLTQELHMFLFCL